MGDKTAVLEPLFDDPNVTLALEQRRKVSRRLALGGLLEIARGQRHLSVEAMAVAVGVGHMTLRRAEDGHDVRHRTYAKLDEYLGLPAGTTLRATGSDDVLIEIARKVGVDVSRVNRGSVTPEQWVDEFASGAMSQGLARQSRAHAGHASGSGAAGDVRAQGGVGTPFTVPALRVADPDDLVTSGYSTRELAAALLLRIAAMKDPDEELDDAAQAVLKIVRRLA